MYPNIECMECNMYNSCWNSENEDIIEEDSMVDL